jgi:hypothetical protein
MNLKKLVRYIRVNLLGPGPRLIKKNLPGRGLTKVEKHCHRESIPHRLLGHTVTQTFSLRPVSAEAAVPSVTSNRGIWCREISAGSFSFSRYSVYTCGCHPINAPHVSIRRPVTARVVGSTLSWYMRDFYQQSVLGTCFSLMASVFPCQYHLTDVSYLLLFHLPPILCRLDNWVRRYIKSFSFSPHLSFSLFHY